MLKFFGVAAWVALLCFVVSPAMADVQGQGDITPSRADVDFNGDPITVPDLPSEGGDVGGEIIVGGTGSMVGDTTFGIMSIDNPLFTNPLLSTEGTIGGLRDGAGQVSVNGFGSLWQIETILHVGEFGQGTLNLTNGARVTTGGSGPVINSDIFIGEFVESFNGVPFRAQGFVNVSGFGSQLSTETLHVGEEGDGFLEVLDFAMVDVEEVFIAEETDSTGEVILDGQGTRMLVENQIEVGHRGDATLVVRNRAFLRSETAMMGITAGSLGSATVSDQGTVWLVDDDLTVGNAGGTAVGQLYINNSGLVRVDGTMVVSVNSLVDLDTDDLSMTNAFGGTLRTAILTNSGVVRGHGRIEAAITNTATGSIRNAADLASLRQQLLVTGLVTNDGVIESLGGEMEFESLVTNNVGGSIVARDAVMRFRGGLVNNGEILILPDSSSLFDVSGTVTLGASSILSLFVGDDDSSLLAVSGDIDLGGTIDISFLDGFVPQSGESFELISSTDTISGTFGTENIPEIPGLFLAIDYRPNSVFLTTLALDFLQADFDSDGDVDGVDLAAWEKGFGMTPGAAKTDGDANLDGDVDGGDFLTWQRQFNLPPPLAAVASVPEPGSLVLVFSAVLLGWRRRV